jgi:hypothetical protein
MGNFGGYIPIRSSYEDLPMTSPPPDTEGLSVEDAFWAVIDEAVAEWEMQQNLPDGVPENMSEIGRQAYLQQRLVNKVEVIVSLARMVNRLSERRKGFEMYREAAEARCMHFRSIWAGELIRLDLDGIGTPDMIRRIKQHVRTLDNVLDEVRSLRFPRD